ncbi:MAG: sporulation protein YqfD [Ruminococcus sp.]|nr:sporulation protein YqfD [Ruminococcus sp.]
MVLKIIRWFRGYILFRMTGAFPERFLNSLNRQGICHWDFVPSDDGYVGKMFLSDYLRIRPTARNSSVRLKSEKRTGFPFFIRKYKRRKGLLFGAVAAVIILTVMSQFVWDIKIVGADGLSTAELISAFDECGLKVGIPKGLINVESVERQVELKVPDVRWIAVNMLNNVATVEIKQQSERPKMNSGKSPCNIKASDDGVITDIIVNSGTCEVKRGSAVVKNQLLVNSVVPIGEDKQKYVHSQAEIRADVIDKQLFIIPEKKNKIILKKNYIDKSKLNFLCLNIPFEVSPSREGIKACNLLTESIRINDITLPLGKTTRREYSFDKKESVLKNEDAKKTLKNKMALYECFCEGESSVKQRKIKLEKKAGSYALNVDYIFNRNIAKKQKLTIE